MREREGKRAVTETPPDADLEQVAELFKVFGDFTRVRILFVLFGRAVCVQDIAGALDMTPSAISHQLRVLKSARLVRARREGKTILYSLADNHVTSIFAQALDHIRE